MVVEEGGTLRCGCRDTTKDLVYVIVVNVMLFRIQALCSINQFKKCHFIKVQRSALGAVIALQRNRHYKVQ